MVTVQRLPKVEVSRARPRLSGQHAWNGGGEREHETELIDILRERKIKIMKICPNSRIKYFW